MGKAVFHRFFYTAKFWVNSKLDLNLITATSLREGKLWIQTAVLRLNIDPVLCTYYCDRLLTVWYLTNLSRGRIWHSHFKMEGHARIETHAQQSQKCLILLAFPILGHLRRKFLEIWSSGYPNVFHLVLYNLVEILNF